MALANIVDNIVTALGNINGSSPYTVAVARVNERLVNNLHTSGSNLPALEVSVESVEHGDPADIYGTLPRATIAINGWVEVAKDASGDPGPPHDALLPLWEDVKTALRVDESRGGTVSAFYLTTTTFAYGEDQAAFSMKATAVYGE